MTLLGAKSHTSEELLNAFGVPKEKEEEWHTFLGTFAGSQDDSAINFANKVFVEKTFAVLTSFSEQLQKFYGVEHGEVRRMVFFYFLFFCICFW